MSTNFDEAGRQHMARALELAARARGGTSPNPLVGCVIVKDGVVVGEGWHRRAGGPHAEIEALAVAGERARGATVYVTLEPCCHTGRTGPCSTALISAGVKAVVIARRDPNPRVAGGGVAALEAAGIVCETGLFEAEAAELNRIFEHWITTRLPYVVLKLAVSIDGRLAREPGPGHAVTGPVAHAAVHAWRAAVDGVAVGSETALVDDPQLTARGEFPEAQPPWRVVFDSRLKVPRSARIFAEAAPGAITVCALDPEHRRVAAVRAAGIRVICAPGFDKKGQPTGRVDIRAALAALGAFEPEPLTSLLVEGGGGLAAAFLDSDAVDEVVMHIAPDFFGADGVTTCGPLKAVRSFERVATRVLGRDLEVVYRRPGAARNV